MPTKHIPDETWSKVEKETVKAVLKTQKSIKATDMLNLLILKGIESLEETDYKKVIHDK